MLYPYEGMWYDYVDRLNNRGIIIDGVPEMETYIEAVLPNVEEMEQFKKELLEIVVKVQKWGKRTG